MATTETSQTSARASRPGPQQFPDRQDDGLFGPRSVSWKLIADPSAQLAATTLVSTRAALNEYVEAQSEWLAVTLPAAIAMDGIRQHETGGGGLAGRITQLAINGALGLLPPWARQLYGLNNSLKSKLALHGTVSMLALARRSTSYEALLRKTLGEVEDHPYRRIRR